MRSVTVEFLHSLENIPWFDAVGRAVEVEGAVGAKSWAEAISHCTSDAWNDLRLQARNQMTMKIWETSQARWREWNELNREIGPLILDLVSRKSQSVMAENGVRDEFLGSVVHDVALAVMECEYGDLVSPGLPQVILGFYRLGHFPCGVDAATGELIIY